MKGCTVAHVTAYRLGFQLRMATIRPDTITQASGDTSAAQLGKWGPEFDKGVDRMRRLVCE